jgi:acetolactate synthase-1/2/3 large subunit
VKHGQEETYGPDRTPGTELGWRHYEKVVEALGGHGEVVERLDDLGPALERALAAGKPACINVPTDPTAVFRGMTALWPIT